RGFYNYAEGISIPQPSDDAPLLNSIGSRILTMLINEAYDAVYYGVASVDDVDLAMTKGVNYPKGLIAWGREIGQENVRSMMDNLYSVYNEDRYRASLGLDRF
ncbi:MAG: 3-hydroxyacyl-CoA dehydrogenase family protein, partial [Flavobacteriales bacterium]